jgi:predicted lipoprotein with Yx(FWY)xxD motif
VNRSRREPVVIEVVKNQRTNMDMHRRTKRLSALLVVAAAGLALTACGSSAAPRSSTTTTTKSGSAAPVVGSTSIAAVGSVVTGVGGRTLYYLSTETSTSIQCTGTCTQTWFPYVLAAGSRVAVATGVTGSVSSTVRPNGTTQVTYDGHPVYYFAGDSAPGQANGQGADGTWFVLSPASRTVAPPTTTTTSGGSSNGY